MSLTAIIFRNLRKNIRHYYLYVFALIFSVALYFSFVTLQYDPAMEETKGSIKGAAALGAASMLLVAIVAVFLLYANTIFIKRRSKEIGLLQLIGLTKGRIFGLLTAENLMLYFASMVAGIAAGFAASRLILMILFKIIGVDALAKLRFSPEALLQTVIVFAAIYVLIMIMNYAFIKRQSILSLFRAVSVAQERIKKLSAAEIWLGLLGIAFILGGYYLSSELFGGRFVAMNELMTVMIAILALVIAGTYFFYKGSVSFIFNAIRRSRNGYLSVGEVLSLSSIMFRMKSNALLLTVITTISALAIGLLSLSYISYYSTDTQAKATVPNDFAFANEGAKNRLAAELDSRHIAYTVIHRKPVKAELDASRLMSDELRSGEREPILETQVLSETMVDGIQLEPDEAIFMDFGNAVQNFLSLKDKGDFQFIVPGGNMKQRMIGSKEESALSYNYGGGFPTAIVDDSVYQQLVKAAATDQNPDTKLSDYYGLDIKNGSNIKEAHGLFVGMELGASSFSQYEYKLNQRTNMGIIMFIVGFLGLTFLITSGCILYFKQMDESEEEKPNYTILRKLGFTQSNLLRGIRFKQLFNFGIPLIVGLSHSYFAVKSGWFFFGTEMLGPMFIVMALYTALYSTFGVLSVAYYKRVIKESL
ncbi:bacitracin transport system permease protein [Paenibacillaceae bacterium GAS479]|nr:bacitracin transport system permease protein [Paenibacillaceae bacterium GAS479]